MELRIPFATLLKIGLAILLAAILVRLWGVILTLVFATLLAILLDPLVLWLQRHGFKHALAVIAVTILVVAILFALFFGLVPAMGRELADVTQQIPDLIQRINRSYPTIGRVLIRSGVAVTTVEQAIAAKGFTAGKFAVEAVTVLVFAVVVALYLLLEGRRAFSWLITFAPAGTLRSRIDRTASEVRDVVLAYMRGAFITATICACYVMAVLTFLKVPAALLLAALAFIADFVPVVGTIVMMVPATLLGLVISPGRALEVAAAYLLYHVIEAYILIPRIYGREMRVSTLTVLVAIAIGGSLIGIPGAVLALPAAAAYPIIERIWLRDRLPSDTVTRHEELEEGAAR
ncbi:MAG TPA: AI-2E family transporter [Thermoanaerobaculia bacterium]|nr:AI-2E family transporter [Thermoanaerobaculia bacterium]